MKKALVTGISGQDGSYAAELLLREGYVVYGVVRPGSNAAFIEASKDRITLIEGELSDREFVVSLVQQTFDEVYHFASVATVASPWEDPIGVSAVVGMVPLYFLEAIRQNAPQTRFFQASSAEMFGSVQESPQDESTRFEPQNPYGMAKLFAHHMVENYRSQHGLFAVSGILFNHESPRRSPSSVTKKTTATLARIAHGSDEVLELGNLNALRDWSFAGDIVEAAWLSLQAPQADTFVLSSGETHSVRDFVSTAALKLGITLSWAGEGDSEYATAEGKVIVRVNPRFYRSLEPYTRRGNSAKAERILGWQRKVGFEDLVSLMVEADTRILT